MTEAVNEVRLEKLIGRRVRDVDGKPVANAEVTLWVADEGVLSLTGFNTPDPLRIADAGEIHILVVDQRNVFKRSALPLPIDERAGRH